MSKEISIIPTIEEMSALQVMAKNAHQSKFFEKLNGEAGILSIMLMARELGLPPIQSVMGGMSVIQGKIEVSPRMMNTMIRKAGHKIEILESSDTICKLKGTRHDTKEEYTCTYSLDDARKAGLVRSGGGWEKYPSDMLFARCLSRLARRLFADVISSAYVEGEISESDHISQVERMPQTYTQEKETEIIETESPITIEKFMQAIYEKFGDKYSLEGIGEYLSYLEKEKQVKSEQIMKQAISPALIERFCIGLQKWKQSNNLNNEGSESK